MAKNECIEKEIVAAVAVDFILFVFALNIRLEEEKCGTQIADGQQTENAIAWVFLATHSHFSVKVNIFFHRCRIGH